MIYVLLVKNQMHDVLEQAVSRVLIESAGREWERIGMHQVCRDIRGKIREEILLKELKKGTDSPRHDGP